MRNPSMINWRLIDHVLLSYFSRVLCFVTCTIGNVVWKVAISTASADISTVYEGTPFDIFGAAPGNSKR